MSDAPMDWTEYHLARQLLAEERMGRAARAEVAAEDDEFATARVALRG